MAINTGATHDVAVVSAHEPKKTLSLTGVTINAMALIAPGAFLWITFQLQAAAATPKGDSVATDMWQGVVFALIIAFLTAISYSELAKIYPDAGYGSAYYFAEKTFLDREEAKGAGHGRLARFSKILTGWAAHLFYWVYPGVMVAFMATLISYIGGLFGMHDANGDPGMTFALKAVVCVVFAGGCGLIAMRGIAGSTLTSLIVNVIQLATLVIFSVLAIIYRVSNPQHATFTHAHASSIIVPHAMFGVLIQSSIAILILVGFESCTALGAEAKNAKRDVPRGILLSLIIQGLFAYLLQYFAANYALSDKLTYFDSASKTTLTGMDAAAKSQAPIGDMMRLFGDHLLHGIGFGLTVTMAVTVALAILGTVLACLNTAVRVSYAMSKDKEMPEIMGLMNPKYQTPTMGIAILVIVSAIIGIVGVKDTVALTGISIASNLGTFILYALICVWTVMAFSHRQGRNPILHIAVPIVGLLTNLLMIGLIFYLAFATPGDTQKEGRLALEIAVVWGVVSLIYVVVSNARTGRRVLPAKTASPS